MIVQDYFARTGLEVSASAFKTAQAQMSRMLDGAKSKRPPSNATPLYEFKVPKLSVDGICSLRGEYEAKPYDLTEELGGRSTLTTGRLSALDALVAQCHEAMNIDWLGVYQVRRAKKPVLVKLAYRGIVSRAEFPLTAAFAAKSNNSAVAMTGKGRLINDVMAHLSKGGSYYECDPNVQAEACLPIFEGSRVVGIVDAEHSAKLAFTSDRLATLIALCLELPDLLPGGGANAPSL